MPRKHPRTVGDRLAGRLASCSLTAPVVLALTSGSLPIASDIARRLGGEAERIFVEGMDDPSGNGRCGGAVSETGHLALERTGERKAGTEEALAQAVLNQVIRLLEKRLSLMPGTGLTDSVGRNVILVADGLAGGATMIAAIRGVRSQRPLRLVAAVGVATSRTLDRIRAEADETVALSTVAKIGDVGRARHSRRKSVPAPSR